MVTSEKQILTVSEAAAMLNAHPNSVRRWAEIGLLDDVSPWAAMAL
jgi:hypothetical protein